MRQDNAALQYEEAAKSVGIFYSPTLTPRLFSVPMALNKSGTTIITLIPRSGQANNSRPDRQFMGWAASIPSLIYSFHLFSWEHTLDLMWSRDGALGINVHRITKEFSSTATNNWVFQLTLINREINLRLCLITSELGSSHIYYRDKTRTSGNKTSGWTKIPIGRLVAVLSNLSHRQTNYSAYKVTRMVQEELV